MKGLDTPILLGILHDAAGMKELLRALRGDELATTELNLFELEALSAAAPKSQRAARQTGLARLRRRLTVLPITPEGTRESSRFLYEQGGGGDYRALVWGTMAAAGCAEWITTRVHAPPRKGCPFKVRLL
jgi:predicted nucleic acid-binding protein